jgi:hypothetical protein
MRGVEVWNENNVVRRTNEEGKDISGFSVLENECN